MISDTIRSWWERFLRVLAIVCILAAGVFVLELTRVGDWHSSLLRNVSHPQQADYILLLGGDYHRPAEAARLWHLGYAPKIVASSWGEDAHKLARVAANYGVKPEAILVDDRSVRTQSHPAGIQALAGLDPATAKVIIVTSIEHTGRCVAVFKKAGYANVTACPVTGDDPQLLSPGRRPATFDPISRASRVPFLWYETFAWLSYSLRGWV